MSQSVQMAMLCTAAAVIILCCAAGSAHARGFLRVQGHDMVDEDGNKILLRGVGLGNWMLPEGYMWRFGREGDRPRRIEKLVSDMVGPEAAERFWREYRRNYITEADVVRIKQLGFNSVRPALNARLFLTEGDDAQWVDEGFELLDDLIAWCKKHDLYVIIDMHGAPGGQTGQNIDDSPNDLPELFTDDRNQDRLVELWVRIAERYKDEPTVAAYDLLNEPLPANTGAADKHKHQLIPLYKRITAAIREVDRRHMITLEGFNWSNDWSLFDEPFDDNTFYQFHYYCWNRPTHLNDISQYLRHRERLNRPVWVGETGEKDNTIYWATTQYFEANNIGWSFWPWKKMDTTNTPYSIHPPEGWDEIRAYSRGEGEPVPPRELAQRALDQLLENIKIENCRYHPDVVNSILRRAPVRIEGENYGHEGEGTSYSVRATENSPHYRTREPVPVALIELPQDERDADAGGQQRRGRRRDAGQAVRLEADEWTAYTVRSASNRAYPSVLKVKRDGDAPAEIEVSAGGASQRITVNDADWTELDLEPLSLSTGENGIRLTVHAGAALIDWLELHEP